MSTSNCCLFPSKLPVTRPRISRMEARDFPAHTVLDAARHRPQMIVIALRGMKAIKRCFLGGVSEKILVHATYPVLIVRGGRGSYAHT